MIVREGLVGLGGILEGNGRDVEEQQGLVACDEEPIPFDRGMRWRMDSVDGLKQPTEIASDSGRGRWEFTTGDGT